MRPRQIEVAAPQPEPSPSPLPPTTRSGGGLYSMVVRPSDSGGVGEVVDPVHVHAANDCRHSPWDLRFRDSPRNLCRRDSPLVPRHDSTEQDLRHLDSPLLDPRCLDLPGLRRRGDSPPPFHHRRSPAVFCRRGGPAGFHRWYQRFSTGYAVYNVGSISPSHRQKPDGHYDLEFDGPLGPCFGHGLQGGRFGDDSPPYGPGRGCRSFGRGYNASGQGFPPFEGEYVHRNDLNLSPREGDWICQNPFCGNLNFAQRTYCNNCNKYRYEPQLHGRSCSRSPQRGFLNSPSPHGSASRIFGPPIDRGLQRNLGRYRSPPHGLGVDGPRDFGFGSPPPGCVGRFVDHMRGERPDYHYELDYIGGGKFDRPVLDELDRRDHGRDGFIPDRRGYDRCPPSPHGQWGYDSRERSRSLIGNRSPKRYYMGLGRDDQHIDDSYVALGRTDDLDLCRGCGYRQGGDSFAGPGQDDRWSIAHGGNNDVY